MKTLITIVCFGIMSAFFTVQAGECAEPAGRTAIISVKGLVCEFCVKNIEKIMKKQKEVEDVSIDLQTATAKIVFKNGQTIDDQKLRLLIKEAGYEIDTIKRL